MRVLAISGSLRAVSYNTALLRAAMELAPDGVEIELYDELEHVPPYNEDRDTEQPPSVVAQLRESISGADAILFATPEYNGTVPGHLKNALDWASRPFGKSALWGKPVAAIGASTGMYGALWAQADLRKALGIAGARVLEAELAVGKAADQFSEDGELTNEETRDRLNEILDELSAHHHHYAMAA
jgi:chromate reductase